MSKTRGEAHVFDDPRNRRRLVRGLILICALLFGLDAFLHRHVLHPWEGLFGFYALYGFVACVVLVLLAKELRKLVMRDEHYYEQGSPSDGSATNRDDRDA